MTDGLNGGLSDAYKKSDQSEFTIHVMDDSAPYFNWTRKEVEVFENSGKCKVYILLGDAWAKQGGAEQNQLLQTILL